jgi:hypothetical protein
MSAPCDFRVLEIPDEARREIHDSWFAAMRRGDFQQAWQATDRLEEIRRRRGFRVEENGELWWDGTPFEGRHVFVRCLHGLGDTLQFIRFLPLLARVARRITVAVQPALLPLFAPAQGVEFCNGWTDYARRGDTEIEVMELAYAFRATADTLPPVPYLDREWIERQGRIQLPPAKRRLRAGLVWEASTWDGSRSLPPEHTSSLQNPDIEWYSLQQHRSSPDLPFPMHDLSAETGEVLQAAHAMLQLDLIITVDSMPAHLAGALGCPVWLLLKQDADWRWQTDTDLSPWYPGMRLFRQPRDGDWSSPLREATCALNLLSRESPRVIRPIH